MAAPSFALAFVRITRVDDLFLDDNDPKASPFRAQVLVSLSESDSSSTTGSSCSSCSSSLPGSETNKQQKWHQQLCQVAQNVLLMAFATTHESCGSGTSAFHHQLVRETSWLEFFQSSEPDFHPLGRKQIDQEDEEEEEEEEIFNREVDPIGFRDLPMGYAHQPRDSPTASEAREKYELAHSFCFFQLPNDPSRTNSIKGIACVDPKAPIAMAGASASASASACAHGAGILSSHSCSTSTSASSVSSCSTSSSGCCFQVALLFSNLPFQMFLKDQFQSACREMFLQNDLFSEEEAEQAQRHAVLTKLYHQLASMDFSSLPYREIFVGLPLVPLARRLGKDLMGILRLILLGGRIVCFASDTSVASCFTLSMLAFLPGSLAIHSDFTSRPLQVALYRLKRFGMPFSLFDEDFVLQPCFTLFEQENVFNRAGGFLLGTNDSLLLRHPNANLDAIVDFENFHVIAFPTPKAEASFALGAQTAAFGDSLAQKFGRSLKPPSPKAAKASPPKEMASSPFSKLLDSTAAGGGASMEANHSEIDWTLAQFQSYFEHFAEQANEYVESANSTTRGYSNLDESNNTSDATGGILSRLEEIAGPFIGESSSFLNEFGRNWFSQWQKTNIYDRWQSATQVERRRTTCVSLTPPPKEGQGRFTYPNGDEYEGHFSDGRRHGFGVYVEFVTKNQYEGDWANDERHGKGILISKVQGYIYDGEWSHNIREGFGNSTLKNVESYSGYWHANRFHGSGVYSNTDGEVYDGEWNMGVREGVGKLTISKSNAPIANGANEGAGSTHDATSRGAGAGSGGPNVIPEEHEFGGVKEYMGEWKNNKFNGTGKVVYVDGSHYFGDFQDGKRHGNGFLKFASGDTYDGQWWKGFRHGEGSFFSATSGITKEGTWRKNVEVDGVWFIKYKNGDKYNGQSRRGRPWGSGVCKYINGSSYNGEWIDGLREGRGVFISVDGIILEGEWRSGLLARETSQTASDHSLFVDIALSPTASPTKRNQRAMTAPESPPLAPAFLNQCSGGFGASLASLRRLSGLVSGGYKGSESTPTPPDRGVHTFVYSNGDIYEGEFKSGMRDGHGTFTERATGNLYEGEWKQNLRHGTGVLMSGTKDFIYDGEWVQDFREGQGYCVIRDCESYAGAWSRNQFHGIGKYIDAEGNVYEGEFRLGKKHGMGQQVSNAPRKESYKGEWKDGQRHGVGEATFEDGSRYSGSWKHDAQEGEGTWTWPNGDQYVGQWRQGQKDGMGTWTSPSGIIKEGCWVRDEMVDGEWSIQFPDQSKYTGQCVRGKPHGRGVCKYSNGDLYDGQWVHGKRHGFGCGFFANGESFEGEWENNHVALNGKGKLTMADGTVHVYNR